MKLILLSLSIMILCGCNGALRQVKMAYSSIQALNVHVDYPSSIELWEPGTTVENQIITKEFVGGQLYVWHKKDPSKKTKELVSYTANYWPGWSDKKPTDAMAPTAPVEHQYVEFASKEWYDALLYLAGITQFSLRR